ncbi:MAG: hypothetical protein M1830_004204, partial [Pleopsidium flavum]
MLSHLSPHVGELKQQGAAEAARDPNNNVTSEDAEQFMVDETKKAGVAAYQFDPYASPEEKAAQARSVSHHVHAGFYHEKKPNGVAVATDLDDGTPDQYDLPPPSRDAAIAGPSADDKTAEPNGHLTEDENTRWVERTGWAPRFGQGNLTE